MRSLLIFLMEAAFLGRATWPSTGSGPECVSRGRGYGRLHGERLGFTEPTCMACLLQGHCGEGAVSPGNQALESTAVHPPVPAEGDLVGPATCPQLRSEHLSSCSKWECSCCSLFSLSLFLPPSFKEDLPMGIRHRSSQALVPEL